ncbi:MAG: glycosyltransferase [Pyrinomonadaceae bacterium]
MKVALVHDYLREYGGAERVLEVLMEMFPDAPVFTSYHDPEKFPFTYQNTTINSSFIQKFPVMWQRPNFIENLKFFWRVNRLVNFYIYLLPFAFRLFDLRGFDLIISSSSYCASGVVTSERQTHICYCHTPPRFLWQPMNYQRSFLARCIEGILRRRDYVSAGKVDLFIANSQTVQNRIKMFYDRDSTVVYPPVDLLDRVAQISPEASLRKEYYLVVSRLQDHKHVQTIVEAFTRLGFPLVIAGTGPEWQNLRAISGRNITFVGFASDEQLSGYYSACKALIIAAEDEDFGMTAVEAQFFGKGVIAPRQGGFVETIIEGETGVFFDTIDVESLCKAIEEFEDLSLNPATIRQNAARFSKQVFKERLAEIIRELS